MATQKSIQNRKSQRKAVSSPDTLTWVSRGLAGALAFLSIIGFLGLVSLDGVVSGAVGVAFTDLFGRSQMFRAFLKDLGIIENPCNDET